MRSEWRGSLTRLLVGVLELWATRDTVPPDACDHHRFACVHEGLTLEMEVSPHWSLVGYGEVGPDEWKG